MKPSTIISLIVLCLAVPIFIILETQFHFIEVNLQSLEAAGRWMTSTKNSIAISYAYIVTVSVSIMAGLTILKNLFTE